MTLWVWISIDLCGSVGGSGSVCLYTCYYVSFACVSSHVCFSSAGARVWGVNPVSTGGGGKRVCVPKT